MVRRIIFSFIGLAVLVGGGLFGWQWWTVDRFFETTDNAYVQSDISVVSPKVEGYVRTVNVVDNQQIHAGDILAEIDDRDFAAKAAQARANVDMQRAAIGSIDSKIVLQRSMIVQAEATLASAAADRKRASQDFDRYRNLVKEDWVSRQKYETADADFRKSDASGAKARAAVAAEQDQIGVLEASRAEAAAQLKQAEATLQLAENDLANTVIRAPVDGVIGNRGVQVGQYVKAGTQMLSVVPLPKVFVVANFKETQLGHMRPGQKVDLHIDAFPDVKLAGTVESFAPASGAQFSLLPPENATGNFTKIVQRVPVRIAVPVDNALSGLLRPGLSVVVGVDTRTAGEQVASSGVFGAAAAATLPRPPAANLQAR